MNNPKPVVVAHAGPPVQAAPKVTTAIYKAPETNDNDCFYGGGGCFGPSSTVVVNGQVTQITAVKKGDIISTADGLATVKLVAKIARDRPLVRLSCGLTITKKHPVRVNGVWMLPKDLSGVREVENTTGFVYNFVLDRSHIVLVNGVECITWGHGFEDPVVAHRYYGT